ncbi:MAG: class I SAM-dependent methyltransferase [Bacteroidales bacterium]|nr:class I SAM-dependent methyltransferase [Bacteroidales bacterium]
MNLYHATAFIRHLLTSRSAAGHGVHSPFVFDFLTDVVRGNNDANLISNVERLRQEMLADSRNVRVTDLGAGSARRLGEERGISDIASMTALPPKQVRLLARMAHDPRCTRSQATQSRVAGGQRTQGEGLSAQNERSDAVPQKREDSEHTRSQATQSSVAGGQRTQGEGLSAQNERSDAVPQTERSNVLTFHRTEEEHESYNSIILELGTSLGISTLALSLAAPEKRVVTVEGCPALAGIARDNLLRYGAANAHVINMEFSEALGMLRHRGTTVSLAFIDGNHRGRALKHYAETIRSLGEEMLIVADDIHLSHDMHEAWQQLALSGIAPVTMETFRFGILFCLHNITPGHYRIRY